MNEGGERGSSARGGEVKLWWERGMWARRFQDERWESYFATGCIEKKKKLWTIFTWCEDAYQS